MLNIFIRPSYVTLESSLETRIALEKATDFLKISWPQFVKSFHLGMKGIPEMTKIL